VGESHAEEQAASTEQWAATDDRTRIPLGFVYTDFDNSGIAGRDGPLSSPNGNVCVRILSEYLRDPALGQVTVDWLTRNFDHAEQRGLDWLLICTWNDWGETTNFEPFWRPGYWAETQSSTFDPATIPSSPEREQMFGRLLSLQANLGAHKGLTVGAGPGFDLDSNRFYQITGQYLKAQYQGTVRKYD